MESKWLRAQRDVQSKGQREQLQASVVHTDHVEVPGRDQNRCQKMEHGEADPEFFRSKSTRNQKIHFKNFTLNPVPTPAT